MGLSFMIIPETEWVPQFLGGGGGREREREREQAIEAGTE